MGEAGDGAEHQRHVEPEDDAPAGEVRERAADERSEAEAEHQEAGPGTGRGRPTLRWRAGIHGGQGARHCQRGGEPLQGASGEQRRLRAGQRNGARREREQRQSRHRGHPRAEAIRRLAAEHDRGCGDDQIGIDRPLHAVGAERKLGLHVRQRSHDRGAVGADAQHRQARPPEDRCGWGGRLHGTEILAWSVDAGRGVRP
jgi:hypothetical protein